MENQIKIFQDKSEKALSYLSEKLHRIRTGRANPSLVEDISVEAYDSKMDLKNLAAISTPEPRLIIIQPWDQSIIPAIEKAIYSSNLGLSPATDKNVIRIAIPSLTAERRQEMIKIVRSELEETRVKIRGFRREGIESIESAEKNHEISEDEEKRLKDEIQKEVESVNEKIEEIGKAKEAELNEI